ncbi:MAG: HEAT repeat domain-containing protein [Gemmatimonadetes bacterium]|nr:HEAT repeat domain-containing protein [Gemmatimonadota bacterium]
MTILASGLALTAGRPLSAQAPTPRPDRSDGERLLHEAQPVLERARAALPGLLTPLPDYHMELSDLPELAGLPELSELPVLSEMAELSELSELSELAALGLAQAHTPLPELGSRTPPAPWGQQDAADSLYRAARDALNRGDNERAARLFGVITQRYPQSRYAPDALYWEAYARFRRGSDEELRVARALLDKQRNQHPKAGTRSDAAALETRIRGLLARRGDAAEAALIAAQAALAAEAPTYAEAPKPPSAPTPGTPAPAPQPAPKGYIGAPRAERPPRPPRAPQAVRAPRRPTGQGEVPAGCPSEEDDDKVAALNALLQMDSELALPVLKKVLARRDPCSVTLRRKAVFLVSQKRSPESADVLLEAVRTDPDSEVRRQGIYWLGQVDADRAVTILEEVLRGDSDPDLRERAIFALSQQRSPRAGQILRAFAERSDAPVDLQEKVIFWIGQRQSTENAEFLKKLYSRLPSEQAKERVLFSLSQMRGYGSERWLMDVALDTKEPLELRKKALFWAGQQGDVDVAQLTALYDRVADREMKEQLIFVYSQRRESGAVDKMMDIARKESDRDLRRKAIFWLSQSHDPRVVKFLDDLINQP